MGLLGKLALLPVSPALGVILLAEQLERVAADEYEGADSLRRQLLELQIAKDEGSIDDAEYEAAAASLFDRMRMASGVGLGLDP